MDKFKYIRVKQSSGEYGTSIPIAVDWSNVDNKPITVDSNGVIDIANIPKAALERLIIVANDTARFALTTATVQTGDTVKVTSTGQMYYIIDDTKLNVEAGYVQYSAGTAASVPWTGVSDKPTTISGYGITDAYTKTQTNNLLNNKVDKISGKGLSTNDYTTTEKNKLAGIAAGAEVNVNPDWNATSGDAAILNKPTTVDGYGITDAYTKSDVDAIVNTSDDTSEAANPIVIETDAAQYAKNTHLTLEPVQDLHGYNHPWPAGGGKNLLDESLLGSGSTKYNAIYVGDGTFTLSTTAPKNNNDSANLFFLAGNVSSGIATDVNGVWNGNPQTVQSQNGYVTVCDRTVDGIDISDYKTLLEKGSTATSYEPYSNICPITPMGHRNLLPMTVDGIKTLNTSTAWNGNQYTQSGITYTILTDEDGNVTGIDVDGTSTEGGSFLIATGLTKEYNNMILSGCPSWGDGSQYCLYFQLAVGPSTSYAIDQGGGARILNFTNDNNARVFIYVYANVTLSHKVFTPMIRFPYDPIDTFIPYSKLEIGTKVTGKNLIKPFTEKISRTSNNISWANNLDGSWTANGTATANSYAYGTDLFVFERLPSGTYTASVFLQDGQMAYENSVMLRVGLGDSNTFYDWGRSVTFELDGNTKCYLSLLVTSRKTVNNLVVCPQLELGSTATDYEPYKGYTASVDLPTTIYGGTLNLETGEVVVDKGIYVFDGSNDESWGQGTNTDANVFYISITTNPIKPISNKYKGVNAIHYSRLEVGEFAHSMDFNGNILGGDFNFRTTFTTLADFKNDLASNPLEVVAGLPSPIIYQLTPQQLALFRGINNISTNAKTVQVTYRNGELATTGNIVESTEVAKQNAIGESASYTDARLATELAPILGNFATAETSPASASHAVGEYLLYNKSLYKVLAAISAGQQLTIGTNIGQTNVAAELASLNNVAIHFIANVNEGSGTQSNLIDVITNVMTVNGFYQIKGTYTNHAYGYTAIGWRVSYSNEPRYAGVIICHDGNVIAFSKQGTSTAVIKVLATP